MFCKGFLTLVCMWWFANVQSQNHKNLLDIYKLRIETENLNLYEKKQLFGRLIQGKENKVDQDKLAHIYDHLLRLFYRENIDISIDYALKIKAIGELNGFTDEFYLKNDKNLVQLYSMKSMHHKAIYYGKQFLIKHSRETTLQAKVYRIIGGSYSDLGDFNEAISYCNMAIYIFKKLGDLEEEGRTIINLLETYVNIGTKAFEGNVFKLLERFDEISNKHQFLKKEILKKELNTGAFYDNIKDYENAKIGYKKSLKLSYELSDSLNLFNSLNNLGIVYRKEHKLSLAKVMFNKASLYIKQYNELKAVLFNNLADVYKAEENYTKALVLYNTAIAEFLQINDNHVFYLPSEEVLSTVENKVDLLGYLVDKANLLLLLKEDRHLQLALKLYALCDQIVDTIYFESREDFSKLFWREKASDIYLNATEISYLLDKPEDAFYYIEKSKALLLLENITNNKAKTLARLPSNIIEKEYILLNTLKETEKELLSAKKRTLSSQKIDSLKNEIFSKNQNYANFIDSLEISYPRYYSFKKKVTVFDATMVQQSLKNSDIVLQYKFDQDKGFLVLITKTTKDVFELQNVAHIHELIDKYNHLLRVPFVNHKDRYYYKDISHELYLSLFPFTKSKLNSITDKKLIIIPDGKLNYIPFEPLVTDSVQGLEKSYLINFCDVSYAYSYSSLNLAHQHNYKKDFFAIYPSLFKDSMLSALPISEKDILNIESILNTSMISNEEATKQRFLEEYGGSKVIHISTHSGVLNDKPWIAFNDQKLMLNDIYFKNQKANLVVLSACKTSHGKLKKGEGVMSISRAFINSGSNSVISSLWNINQQSTNEIISRFYSNLKASKSKSEALRESKIAYLKAHQNTSEASPFYWSSLILTGSTEPIFKSYNAVLLYALIVILLLIIITLIIRIIKK